MTYLEYARRGRTAWWWWPLTLVVGILITLIIAVALGVVLALTSLLPPDLAQQMTAPSRPAVFFPATGITFLILAGGVAAAAALVQAKSPLALIGRWSWARVAQGFALWLVLAAVCAGIDTLLAPGSMRVSVTDQTLNLVAFATLGLAAQTFAEEFIFRGLITQGFLLAFKRPLPAAVLSAAVFGAAHYTNGMPQMTGAFLFGLATALITIRYAGLAFTWGLHLANNLFGAAVVVSSADVFKGAPGLFTQTAPQLLWVDVGLELAALSAVLWLVLRKDWGWLVRRQT